MKKKLGIVLAVVATAVISIVSLVGCAKPDTDLKTPTAQTDALMDVQANQADIAIVDGVFAGYTLAQEGNSYDKLTIIELEDFKPEAESYGVAAKKGKTKLMNFINKRLYEIKDTDYKEICKKYGLQSRAVEFAAPTGEWENWKSEIVNNTITIGFTIAPPYGVAAKKGKTKLMNFINKRLYEIKDTDYKEICKKYGLQSRAVEFAAPTGEWENWKSEIVNNTITIGFTIAPPYGMGSNEAPEGFDFDLAKAVFADQGITIKGKVIEWDSKFDELNSNAIDLVWNGMTIRKGFEDKAEISVPYLTNEQVIVARKDKANSYKKIEDLKGCIISVEKGSAGNNEALKIFNTIDNEVFAAWLEKNPEQKTVWEEIK